MNSRLLKGIVLCGFTVLPSLPAYGSLIGDPVSSILHTAFAGSWSTPNAVVGPGVEFMQTYNSCIGGPCETISLDIDASSFTLRFVNNFPGNSINPTGSFNLGLDGFEFTDLNQTFTGIVFAGSTGGFPVASVTGSSVTANNIRIFMNEPIIPGQGAIWTATWSINTVPEPGSIALAGLGLVGLAAVALRKATKRRLLFLPNASKR